MYNFGVRQKWISRRVPVYEDNTKKNEDETEQKRSFFFNFITSNSIHASSCAIITHTSNTGWCSWLTQPNPNVWNGKIKSPSVFCLLHSPEKKKTQLISLPRTFNTVPPDSVRKKARRKEKVYFVVKESSLLKASVSAVKVEFYRRSEIIEFVINLSNIFTRADWYQVAVSFCCCCRYNHSHSTTYGQPGVLDELLN